MCQTLFELKRGYNNCVPLSYTWHLGGTTKPSLSINQLVTRVRLERDEGGSMMLKR